MMIEMEHALNLVTKKRWPIKHMALGNLNAVTGIIRGLIS